jgi:hypothetical protein
LCYIIEYDTYFGIFDKKRSDFYFCDLWLHSFKNETHSTIHVYRKILCRYYSIKRVLHILKSNDFIFMVAFVIVLNYKEIIVKCQCLLDSNKHCIWTVQIFSIKGQTLLQKEKIKTRYQWCHRLILLHMLTMKIVHPVSKDPFGWNVLVICEHQSQHHENSHISLRKDNDGVKRGYGGWRRSMCVLSVINTTFMWLSPNNHWKLTHP